MTAARSAPAPVKPMTTLTRSTPSPGPIWRVSTRIISVFIPNTSRWAPIADNAAATVLWWTTARAPCQSPTETACTAERPGSSGSSGPSCSGRNRCASPPETTASTIPAIIVRALPTLSSPKIARSPRVTPRPTVSIAPPNVVNNALVATSTSRRATCGSPADSPAATNRLAPVAARAEISTTTSGAPEATASATSPMISPRSRFAYRRTLRRSQWSSNAPANGPMSEYGSSSTARPPATASGSAWRSGLNRMLPTSAAWKIPSVI